MVTTLTRLHTHTSHSAITLRVLSPQFLSLTESSRAARVSAGNAMTPEIASIALVTKLVRVCMLAPMLLALSQAREALWCEWDDGFSRSLAT